MVLEWDTHMVVDFPDDDMNRIVAGAIDEGWTTEQIRREIDEVVMGFEDVDYYAWSSDQTAEVLEEVKNRMREVSE